MNSNQLSQRMTYAARTILSVLAPKLSRIARVGVRFRDDAETASTDGNIVVMMPRDFLGAPIPEDAPVTLGLLAHEMGHWVQPLKQVTEIARSRGAPFWLANIAMDIHAETFVENVFPALKVPLQRTRATVRKAMFDRYRKDLVEAIAANDVRGMALNASLIARTTVEHPWIVPNGPLIEELESIKIPAWLGDFIGEMLWLFHAANVTPGELPHSFETLLDEFPELLSKDEPDDGKGGQDQTDAVGDDGAGDNGGSDGEDKKADSDNSDEADDATGPADTDQNAEDESDEAGSESAEGESDSESDDGDENVNDESDTGQDTEGGDSPSDGGGVGNAVEDEDDEGEEEHLLPLYPVSDFDALGEMLREEMQQIAQDFHPTLPTLKVIKLPMKPPYPKAQRLARALQPRFQTPNSVLEVAAPGRLDRLEMARGASVPLRMDVKGHESPAIKLVLALDVSASMFGRYSRGRIWPALIAAQAVTQAVKEAGGEVVVILFDHEAYISSEGDDSLVWQTVEDLSDHFHGNTSFRFLGEVWRRWPQHQVLLVTDGESSSIPDSFPADRERTSVILISVHSDVSAFAARSVYLQDLNRLASVLAILLPDRRL